MSSRNYPFERLAVAEVLMLQGGASGQFASVPLNLLGSGDAQADYITTGQWLS